MDGSGRRSSRRGTLLSLGLIAAVGALAYANTLRVPFQWDEDIFIGGSPVVKDLDYFRNPDRAEGMELHGALKSRTVGYLSFALNYAVGGLDPKGYHLVNDAIHIANALLVYALVLLCFRTPALREASLSPRAPTLALLAALLFVAHPIQTEAVTYIFQRLASLATCFYLLALLAYVRARLAEGRGAALALHTGCLVAAVLAMKTKENAFTLPLAVALAEWVFFRGPWAPRLLRLLPLLLTLPIIPLSLAATKGSTGDLLGDIVPATRGYEGLSRGVYWLTELRVIVTYLRLLVLPVGQNLDYDYPVYRSCFDPPVLASAALLLSLLGWGVFFLYRARRGTPDGALIGFGILWFFLTLSVESGLVPIPMVINEYRVYLPSVGAFAAAAAGALLLLERLRSDRVRHAALLALFALPVVLAAATHARNAVWSSKISLWEDVVAKSPSLVYPRNNLGVAYIEAGRLDDAVREFETALAIKPGHATALNNLGVLRAQQGRLDAAMESFQAALRYDPSLVDAHNNAGLVHLAQGHFAVAEQFFRTAMQLDPGYAKAHYNLGVCFLRQGRAEPAAAEFRAALRLDPGYAKARAALEELARRRG